MSTVWEDTDGCANNYRCVFGIHLMTVLSSSYGIILEIAMNAPGHEKNLVDRLNAKVKTYLKEQMELIG